MWVGDTATQYGGTAEQVMECFSCGAIMRTRFATIHPGICPVTHRS
jgi:hypothetical protein